MTNGQKDISEIELIPRDTTPEAYRIQIEALRRMGPEGRARMSFGFCDLMHEIIRTGIRQRHPDYDDVQVKLAFIRLTSGKEVFDKFFPGIKVEP